MKSFITFFALLLLASGSYAQMDIWADYGGLYFCPETKDLIYLDWDREQHFNNTVHWSATGQRPKQMEMATQYTMTKREIQNDEYYIRIWDYNAPNAMYDCMFYAAWYHGRHRMVMQLDGGTRKYEFLQIGNMEDGYMDPSTRQNLAMIMTLSHLRFTLYDKATNTYHPEATVTVGMAEDPEVLQVTLALPVDAAGQQEVIDFLCTFDNSFNLRFGIGTVDRSRTAHRVSFEILDNNLLAMHFHSVSGELIASFAEMEEQGY